MSSEKSNRNQKKYGFLLTFLKIFVSFVVAIALAYMVAGYVILYWLAGQAGKKYEKYMEEADKKVVSYKIPDEALPKTPEPIKEKIKDIAEKESKKFPVKQKKKKPRMTREERELFYKFLDLTEVIVYENKNFDPCHSICNVSNFNQYERGKGIVATVRNLTDYFETSEDAALNDPTFNFMVLFTNNMRVIFSSNMMKLVMDFEGDKNVVKENPVLAAKILVEFPLWVTQLENYIEHGRKNGKILENYRKLNRQCMDGKFTYKDAHRQCVDLFDDYHFTRDRSEGTSEAL